MQNTDKKRTRK